MSHKEPNHCIRCRVNSCSYHCGDQECCTLGAIQVDPCPNSSSGKPGDESMCASYKHK